MSFCLVPPPEAAEEVRGFRFDRWTMFARAVGFMWWAAGVRYRAPSFLANLASVLGALRIGLERPEDFLDGDTEELGERINDRLVAGGLGKVRLWSRLDDRGRVRLQAFEAWGLKSYMSYDWGIGRVDYVMPSWLGIDEDKAVVVDRLIICGGRYPANLEFK